MHLIPPKPSRALISPPPFSNSDLLSRLFWFVCSHLLVVESARETEIKYSCHHAVHRFVSLDTAVVPFVPTRPFRVVMLTDCSQGYLQDHLRHHSPAPGCFPGARMRCGLADQYLLDHPGLHSGNYPRAVRHSPPLLQSTSLLTSHLSAM